MMKKLKIGAIIGVVLGLIGLKTLPSGVWFFISPLLIGILSICLGIWYERKKETEGRGWKYIMFSVIGILSLLLGFYVGDEMHLGYLIFKVSGGPLTTFPFALIIYAILFLLGLHISREHSLGFGLKVFGISFLMFSLAFYGLIGYSAHEHYYAKAIDARKLQYTPDEFVDITGEELEGYPALKEAIISQHYVKTHPDEWTRTIDFLDEKGSRIIRFNGEYYEITFITA